MNTGGWFMLILSCGTVISLVVFCFVRVLLAPNIEEDVHAPLDIDTHEELD